MQSPRIPAQCPSADLDTLVSRAGANRVRPVDGFLSWWDGVELWLSGLGFVLQTIVVMPVVLALAYAVAVALDGLLGHDADPGAHVVALRGRDHRVRDVRGDVPRRRREEHSTSREGACAARW